MTSLFFGVEIFYISLKELSLSHLNAYSFFKLVLDSNVRNAEISFSIIAWCF